ncbi:DUF2478 domain-containing protein [Bradyrhizobium viridifuturi]|uniref:DUF2478 domain-containing protein n=1 Tax=Bradyrhizobium viridifuturi TaxID=1654716 RepID=UPI00067F2BF5|nr:DUF2478 domain-containing protein [Bradyrhizobium viridifuturi]
MYAQHSAPPRSPGEQTRQDLVAIVYADEAYPQLTFEGLVTECRKRGLRIAGVLQHSICPDLSRHCNVALEELTTGLRTNLFEDRGPGASGCRLDAAALAEVNAQVARSLDTASELLILNKFGKVEAEGRGLLDLVAIAVDRGVPVIIGVPVRNLDAWRRFSGGLELELSSDLSAALDWLNRRFPVAVAQEPLPATG